MSGLPTLAVRLDDGTDTFPHDVTTYARLRSGITITRGRGDEFGQVQPSQLQLVLDNIDGRFTFGDTTYDCAVDQKIRVSYQHPSPATNNLLTPNQASMETDVSDWDFNTLLGGYVLGASKVQTSAFAQHGTDALLATWTASGTGQWIGTQVEGLVPGRTYTWSVYVRVPTGDPDPRAEVAFIASSSRTSTKNAWTRLQVAFTAPADGNAFVGVQVASAAAADVCYIDAAMVNEGSSAATFTTTQSLTFDRFTGHVQAWPVEWPEGRDTYAVAPITATDQTPRWSRRKLRTLIQHEILADSPVHYFPLAEPSGSTQASSIVPGDTQRLTVVGAGQPDVVFGDQNGAPTDGGTAAEFGGGKYLRSSETVDISATDWTIECVVFEEMDDPSEIVYAAFWTDPVFGNFGLTFGNGVIAFDGGGFGGSTLAAEITPHHVMLVKDGTSFELFVDGVSVDTDTGAVSTSDLRVRVGWFGGFSAGGKASISHWAFYDTALSSARVAAHADAALTGFATDTSDERIERILTRVGVDPADMALEAGVQAGVPAQDTGGSDPTTLVAAVAESEGGILFVDGAGQVALHNRHHRALQQGATNATLDARDLAPDTQVAVDMQLVVNYAALRAATGGEQVAQDDASIAAHEQYPTSSSDVLVATETEALDLAQWLVGNYAEPQPRLPDVLIDLMTQTDAKQAAVIALELGDRFTVEDLPAQAVEGATSLDLVVEGTTETITDTSWAIAMNTSNFYPQASAWLLGDATYGVLGTTTRLHY